MNQKPTWVVKFYVRNVLTSALDEETYRTQSWVLAKLKYLSYLIRASSWNFTGYWYLTSNLTMRAIINNNDNSSTIQELKVRNNTHIRLVK